MVFGMYREWVIGSTTNHHLLNIKMNIEEVVGDPGIEPGVRLREGVTVPCHTLRPVAHYQVTVAPDVGRDYKRTNGASTGKSQVFHDGSKFLFCRRAR